MATRMKVLGIKAAVVGGRVRDLRELHTTELPVSLVCFYDGKIDVDPLRRSGLGGRRLWELVLRPKPLCEMFLFPSEA